MRWLVGACGTLFAMAIAVLLLAGVEGRLGCPAAGRLVGGVPASLVPVFQGAAADFDLGSQGASILAAVNNVESDFDQSNLPGVDSAANDAGAEGPMQFEPGTWARYQVHGPGGAAPPDVYDEIDAVYSAANDLHASGAPANWPAAIFGYNHASAYVIEVLADARNYYAQGLRALGAGTVLTASVFSTAIAGAMCDGAAQPGCGAPTPTATVPGPKAVILPDGDAEAPARAPQAVREMIAAGNRINRFAYSYGGGHGDPAQTMSQDAPDPAAVPGEEENGGPGYDCSSATSYVLWGAGLGEALLGGQVEDSSELESVGDPGPGKWVTIYANPEHAYIEIAGVYLDTAAGIGKPPNPPSTGPRWAPVGSGPAGFTVRHPPGL